MRISLHPHAIHDVTCLSVHLLSLRVCCLFVFVSLLFLFHWLPVLCPAHHLQCRHRRGLKPPWRYTILSQEEHLKDARRGCDNLRPDEFRSDPRCVGQAVVGRGPLAFSGCIGQFASTHSFHAVERPRKVRAAWPRVLSELVPFGPASQPKK